MAIRVGLVGLGAMGTNHARIIRESDRADLAYVFDANKSVCEQAAQAWGSTAASDISQLDGCDAVVVSTSTASHALIAERFLSLGIPLLIEKPLCNSLEETLALVDRAADSKVPVMCGFVERFNPAVSTALRMIDGPVRHLSSYRHSPFNPRASSGVVTDLLIHDLDLTARLAPDSVPTSVGSALWAPSENSFVETADCTLQYGAQMTAIQSASRWGQRKIREIKISTDRILLEVDLLRVTVTAFKNKSQGGVQGEPLTYRSETVIEVPFVRHAGEPLALQFEHFLDLVTSSADMAQELATIEAPHRLAEMVERGTARLGG